MLTIGPTTCFKCKGTFAWEDYTKHHCILQFGSNIDDQLHQNNPVITPDSGGTPACDIRTTDGESLGLKVWVARVYLQPMPPYEGGWRIIGLYKTYLSAKAAIDKVMNNSIIEEFGWMLNEYEVYD